MVMKCRNVPNRTVKRKWNTCGVARVARYARATDNPMDIIGAVARQMGLESIGLPTNVDDTPLEQLIAEYEAKITAFADDVQYWLGQVIEFIDAINGLLDAILGWVPGFLLDSDPAEVGLIALLKAALRKIAGIIVLVVNVLKRIHAFFTDLSNKLAEYAQFLLDLRQFLRFLAQSRRLEPTNLKRYDDFCK